MYTKEKLNRIEDELFGYTRLLEDIRDFKREYDDAVEEKNAFLERYPKFTEDDIRTSRTHKLADPTFEAVWQAMKRFDKHIRYLTKKLEDKCDRKKKVEGFLEDIRPAEAEFVRMYYFRRETVRQVCLRFKIERRTFFYKKKQILEKNTKIF